LAIELSLRFLAKGRVPPYLTSSRTLAAPDVKIEYGNQSDIRTRAKAMTLSHAPARRRFGRLTLIFREAQPPESNGRAHHPWRPLRAVVVGFLADADAAASQERRRR
jgi:hypothetical protein